MKGRQVQDAQLSLNKLCSLFQHRIFQAEGGPPLYDHRWKHLKLQVRNRGWSAAWTKAFCSTISISNFHIFYNFLFTFLSSTGKTSFGFFRIIFTLYSKILISYHWGFPFRKPWVMFFNRSAESDFIHVY